MLEKWRHQLAAARVKPGDGSPLKPFRWWQLFTGRALFSLSLPGGTVYTISVKPGGEGEDGTVKAHLYADGRHAAQSKVPARFPVPGGHIEVAVSAFGLKRCHYVTGDGVEQQLVPDPRSGAGRRARLDSERPGLSRGIGLASVALLVVGLGLNLLQLLEPLSEIPPVNEVTGTFASPVKLPPWMNVALGVGAALGSMERALRMRYSWLDSAAN